MGSRHRAITADVRLSGAAEGRLALSWNDYDMAAVATVSGTIDGEAVELTMPAP